MTSELHGACRRARLSTGGAFVAVLLVAGCGGDEPAAPATSSPAAPQSAEVSSPAEPSPTTSTPPSEASAQPTVPPAEVRVVTELTAFRSPTGNIVCDLAEWAASCSVKDHDWVIPETECELDFVGNTLQLGNDGDVFAGVCSGDTVISDPEGTSAVVLSYGSALRMSDLQCTSRETGMQCEHLGVQHGFEVSRDSYRVF